jgi:hypothetical protein
MSKPGADPSSGISLGDVLRLPERHPACRRREARPGSCTERENLSGDAKGKAQAATTARPIVLMRRARGGLLRSSAEAGVMPVERRERVIAIESGQLLSGDRPQEDLKNNGRRQSSCDGTSRMN